MLSVFDSLLAVSVVPRVQKDMEAMGLPPWTSVQFQSYIQSSSKAFNMMELSIFQLLGNIPLSFHANFQRGYCDVQARYNGGVYGKEFLLSDLVTKPGQSLQKILESRRLQNKILGPLTLQVLQKMGYSTRDNTTVATFELPASLESQLSQQTNEHFEMDIGVEMDIGDDGEYSELPPFPNDLSVNEDNSEDFNELVDCNVSDEYFEEMDDDSESRLKARCAK